MKNKTKVVLGLTAILAGTVGVAGVSTFAWFTTQNTAKISFTDAVVRGDSTHISVSYAATQPANNHIVDGAEGVSIATAGNGSSVGITGAQTQVVDLSGNGQNFYRPMNYAKDGYDSVVSSSTVKTDCTGIQKNVQNGSATYYIAFNITVSNNSDVPTDVYIDAGSSIKAVDLAQNSLTAAKASRVAIWEDATYVPTTQRTLWSPKTEDATSYYLSETAGTTHTYAFNREDLAVYQNEISELDTTDPVGKFFHVGTYTAATKSVGALDDEVSVPTATGSNKGGFVCFLPTLHSTKTFTLTMWIEGTDSAGNDLCINGHVALDLVLAGVQRTIA